jgi:hypothetical protein
VAEEKLIASVLAIVSGDRVRIAKEFVKTTCVALLSLAVQ